MAQRWVVTATPGSKMTIISKNQRIMQIFKRVFRSRVTVALLLFCSIMALAGCENKMHTQRGSVSGLVTDSVGNTIKGALVSSHRSLYKAETDDNGYYTFTSLDVGSHRLMVERNGYYLASKTIDLGYGQVLEGINIKVETLGDMITFSAFRRETRSIMLEVICQEPMSVWAGWRETGSARLQTPPTATALRHQITLSGLFPNSEYLVEIEGQTADGRRFISARNTFKTVAIEDMPGAPDVVSQISVTQSNGGPLLQWKYTGLDPLEGFRVFRGQNGGLLTLLYDEKMVFASQESITDDTTVPGRLYQYAVQTVDLEGDVSSFSEKVAIVPAGRISEDMVWTKALSPISISGDLIVPAGRTLTIEPGVTVSFSGEDAGRTGFSPLVCEMIVEGTLIADGSSEEPIKLISASSTPGRGDWNGLRIISEKTQNPSSLRYLVVSGAETGVALYDAPVTLQNFTARYCQEGLSLNGASGTVLLDLVFEDCTTGFNAENTWYCSASNIVVRRGTTGILLAGNSNFALSSFDIREARDTALRVVDRSSPVIRNGLLQSFKTGLLIGGASGEFKYLTVDSAAGILVDGADVPVIKNCIIVNRQNPGAGNGIEEKTLGRTYQYNNIYGFLQATLNCDQLGAPIINADPRFVGGSGSNYSYQLRADSPVIAASDQGGQLGAYGSD